MQMNSPIIHMYAYFLDAGRQKMCLGGSKTGNERVTICKHISPKDSRRSTWSPSEWRRKNPKIGPFAPGTPLVSYCCAKAREIIYDDGCKLGRLPPSRSSKLPCVKKSEIQIPAAVCSKRAARDPSFTHEPWTLPVLGPLVHRKRRKKLHQPLNESCLCAESH
jgi:hypothetical protein